MKISKYVKLGFILTFAITALVWGLSYLKGHDFFTPVDYFYTRYERVDGLQESSPVTLNGYRVGNVKNIEFSKDNSGDLIVTFMLDNDIKITKTSVARIVSSDIMGTRSVKLIINSGETYFSAGDTIPGEIESGLQEQVSMQVLPLKYKAEELLSSLDTAVTVLTVFFNENARKNLSESFQNINQTIYNLERISLDLQQLMSEEKSNLSSLIRNMEGISGTLKNNSAQFDNVIQNLSSFSDTLAALPYTPIIKDMARTVHSLEELVAKVNSGQSTAGLLFNDDELYNNISGLTAQLEYLITDIRNNPGRYLHLSAINLGKEVYVNTSGITSGDAKNIVFKIHLGTSPQQIPTGSPLFSGLNDVEETGTSGAYSYLAGNYPDYSDAEKMLTTARKNFPDATIVAFREGKNISIEKAIRLLKK